MQFKILEGKNLIHGISDVSFGSMRKSDRNAANFLKSIEVRQSSINKLVWAQQVFGAEIHVCQANDSGIIKGVDGLISGNPSQIIAVVTADCLPILLFDCKNKVVAVLHGSRNSLAKGIIQNAIKKMIGQFGSNPKDILVGIGPHIRVCHYWLKPITYHNLKVTPFRKFFVEKREKTYLDLTKIAIAEFKKLGIPDKNIEDCKVCTFCKYKKYFSARRQEIAPSIYRENKPVFASFIGLYQP